MQNPGQKEKEIREKQDLADALKEIARLQGVLEGLDEMISQGMRLYMHLHVQQALTESLEKYPKGGE